MFFVLELLTCIIKKNVINKDSSNRIFEFGLKIIFSLKNYVFNTITSFDFFMLRNVMKRDFY